jgi:hypothetical protein
MCADGDDHSAAQGFETFAAATEIHFKALQRYNRCAGGIIGTFAKRYVDPL